jgi:hypothetical protein
MVLFFFLETRPLLDFRKSELLLLYEEPILARI